MLVFLTMVMAVITTVAGIVYVFYKDDRKYLLVAGVGLVLSFFLTGTSAFKNWLNHEPYLPTIRLIVMLASMCVLYHYGQTAPKKKY